MNKSDKAAQTRLVVAISLFAAAVISAMALTALGNQSDTYWVAGESLVPGTQISESDLVEIQVSLGKQIVVIYLRAQWLQEPMCSVPLRKAN